MEKQMLKKLGLGTGIMAGCLVACASKTNNKLTKVDNKIAETSNNLVSKDNKKAELSSKKIVVVDMPRAYDDFHKTKPAQDNFQLLVKQAQEALEKKIQGGKKLWDERDVLIEKLNNPTTPEEKKQELKKQLADKDQQINMLGEEINRSRQETDEKLDQQRQAILAEHFKEINAAIESLAKQKDVDFVLNKASVLYSKPEFDITDEVIKIINKPVEKTNKTAAKESVKSEKK